MNFSFIGRIFSLLSIKKFSIFGLIILIIIGVIYLFSIYKTDNQDTMLLVHTINNLQKDIKGIQASQTKDDNLEEVKGKVDPQLISEFRDDEQFLKVLVELKKEKMLHQLAIEVEGLRRQREKANEVANPPAPPPKVVEVVKEPEKPAPPPRPKIQLAIANESNQSAVVTIDGGNPITLRVGNVVSNYKLINVTRNYIQVEDLVLNTIESIYIQ